MILRLMLLVFITTALYGCSSTRYHWDGYDDKLYSYYKTPAESERLVEGLYEIIQEGEAENRIPPGIYAEYGYMMYERGRFPEAAIWFGKERDKWPESRFFMERMIAISRSNGVKKQAAPKTPAETSGDKKP